MIAKLEAMPMRLPSRRKMRTQTEWKVPTHSSRAFAPIIAGGLVREGYRKDAIREDVFLAEEVRDPVREDAGFAASGTCKNEDGPFGLLDSMTLDLTKSVSLDNHQTLSIRRGRPLRLGASGGPGNALARDAQDVAGWLRDGECAREVREGRLGAHVLVDPVRFESVATAGPADDLKALRVAPMEPGEGRFRRAQVAQQTR